MDTRDCGKGKIHYQIHLQQHKYPFHHESIHRSKGTCSSWGDDICNKLHLLVVCSRAKVNLERMFWGPEWMASRHGRTL